MKWTQQLTHWAKLSVFIPVVITHATAASEERASAAGVDVTESPSIRQQVESKNEAKPFVLDKRLSGGQGTVTPVGDHAFSLPAANLPLSQRLDFSVGNSFFRNPWVQAPSTTDARDGLGPLFNTNGCENCHIRDGRGHPPQSAKDNAVSMLIRLSVPATSPAQQKLIQRQGVIGEPTYGTQLQDFALPGQKPEAKVAVEYHYQEVQFADGYTVTLRKPKIVLSELAYGKMSQQVQMSARIAPPMIGLGLLESIDDATLLAAQDPNDYDQDGISGRVNWVWDRQAERLAIGRFGWKAGQPTLMQQNASAFSEDLGLTSHMFPKPSCQPSQTLCQQLPDGGSPEVSKRVLNFVEFYTRHLAVPARRQLDDALALQGEKTFTELGCGRCHQPVFKTGNRPETPALSQQVIHPYSDLLLHDMGEGLADNRPEFTANGREWRTPPLWGIGYTKKISGHTHYLHDGRARNLLEAILWHGGEAEPIKQQVLQLNEQQREALVAFLQSL
ncbi:MULTISPECIES: di-heme oxidoredictase family protein [unclassified Vibrio]|uniref:Di-heme oxidoredictase family protein n=1 Tax=Vibrio sp. HB236076 TaxID=3232307 RepID=A0AB39HD64_9VIBR|nr:di-heme oxidoredictase family protein [Vibrio sp. HB161653]MDP5253518.1 di-heme oxidoredictase family protein [Vibrio sp. HB161653]